MYLIIILFQTAASLTVPVLIVDTFKVLDPKYISNNPFLETSAIVFQEVVYNCRENSDKVLIFIEKEFSVEDISLKDATGSPYRYMHQSLLEKKVKYIPSVTDPFKILQKVLPPVASHVDHVTDSVHFPDKDFKYRYLFFVDPEENNSSKTEILRRHDAIVKEAYDKLYDERREPTIIIYTGMNNPMLRVGVTGYKQPIVKPSPPPAGTILVAGPGALVRLTGITLERGFWPRRLHAMSAKALRFGGSDMAMRVQLEKEQLHIDFNIERQPDSWWIESAVLSEEGVEVGRTYMGVEVPNGNSYRCRSDPLYIVNTRDNSYIRIAEYQLQARNGHWFWDYHDRPPPPPKPRKTRATTTRPTTTDDTEDSYYYYDTAETTTKLTKRRRRRRTTPQPAPIVINNVINNVVNNVIMMPPAAPNPVPATESLVNEFLTDIKGVALEVLGAAVSSKFAPAIGCGKCTPYFVCIRMAGGPLGFHCKVCR